MQGLASASALLPSTTRETKGNRHLGEEPHRRQRPCSSMRTLMQCQSWNIYIPLRAVRLRRSSDGAQVATPLQQAKCELLAFPWTPDVLAMCNLLAASAGDLADLKRSYDAQAKGSNMPFSALLMPEMANLQDGTPLAWTEPLNCRHPSGLMLKPMIEAVSPAGCR